jgi:c-di-GMP-binding flagellar brake protein YcgR
MRYYERERREYVRVKAEVAVRYRFLSHDPAFEATDYTDGITRDVSGGGVLMDAIVPDADWIPALLTEHIFLGIELDLPGGDKPVRALTRAAWVQADVRSEDDCCLMGLRFKEITREDLDRVIKYVIIKQLA